jgi:hypothetical protein
VQHVAADNRLTGEELAALVPGDPVTIEFDRDYRRPKHVAGLVVQLVGSRIVVSCRSDRGVPYVHEFGVRDGVRIGNGGRAELVAADAQQPRVVISFRPLAADTAARTATRLGRSPVPTDRGYGRFVISGCDRTYRTHSGGWWNGAAAGP